MSTSLNSDLHTEWQQWHSARERALATPHGWLSLTSFHWLPESPSTLAGLPGLFSIEDGQAVLTATVEDGYLAAPDEGGRAVPVDGAVRAEVAEAKSLEWLTLGDVVVELARRGGRYAIRTRDPRAPALRHFAGVPAFEVDEKWLLEGRFEPYEAPQQITVQTARGDLVQQITGVGAVTLEIAGGSSELIATDGAAGTLNIAFHDSTNGTETARWRTVATTVPDAGGRVRIDFNRAVNFPFAFSDHGTCPAPPAGNTLPVAITGGELAPTAVGSNADPR
jgi:uncharacterized protein (DUF1684 family)